MTALLNASGDIAMPAAAELAEADGATEILTLTSGTTDDGRPYWLYAAITPSRYAAFMAATTAKQRFEITDYGRVLTFGFDAAVPPDIKEAMKRDYGFDENYEAALAGQVKAEREAFLKGKEEQRLSNIVAMLKKQPIN